MKQKRVYEVRRVFTRIDAKGESQTFSYELNDYSFRLDFSREPDCYGVYTRDGEGLLEWVSDHDTLVEAEFAVASLNTIAPEENSQIPAEASGCCPA